MFKIMGIDPGSHHIGISIFTINDKLVVIEMDSINMEIGNISNNRHLCNSDIIMRSNNFQKYIHDIVYHSNPLIIAIESSFSNHDRPTAVIALSKILGVLHNTIYSINPNIKIMEIPPLTAKKAINMDRPLTKTDIKDKTKVREWLCTNPELKDLVKDLVLSEHEVDAIAVTYSMLVKLRENPAILVVY